MTIVYRNGVAGKVCSNPSCRQWKPLSEFHPRRTAAAGTVGDGYKSRCKDCLNHQKRQARAEDINAARAKARAYVASKLEHIGNLKRRHQQQHPEKYASALARYREANRDLLNARVRANRQTNLAHYREIGRRSRERHQDARNAYQRRYNQAHRDKIAAAVNRRRARLHQAPGSHTLLEWQALKMHHDFSCLCCGRRESEVQLTRDHVIPLSAAAAIRLTTFSHYALPATARRAAPLRIFVNRRGSLASNHRD